MTKFSIIKRLSAIILGGVILITSTNITYAKTAKKVWHGYGIDWSTVYTAIMTTQNIDAKKFPLYSSQTKHRKGIATTISINKSVTNELSASASVTAGTSAFVELSATLEVSTSCSNTIDVGRQFSISEKKKTGYYRVVNVFPACNVNKKYSVKKFNHQELVTQTNIKHAPKKNDAYITIEKYK